MTQAALFHYTPSRFERLVALQAKLKRQWWDTRLNDSGFDHEADFYQRRREKLLKALEHELNEMCFYGLREKEA